MVAVTWFYGLTVKQLLSYHKITPNPSSMTWPKSQRCDMTQVPAVWHDQSPKGVTWPNSQNYDMTQFPAVWHDTSPRGVTWPKSQQYDMTQVPAVWHDPSPRSMAWPKSQQYDMTQVQVVWRDFCDNTMSPVSVFLVVGLSIAIQLGMNPTWLFFECFITMFIFYAAHWQTYCTGTLKFGRYVLVQFSLIHQRFIMLG